MTRDDLMWLAGYLEGEGSFVYHKNTQTHRVCVQSTDKDVLERLVGIVGKGKVGGPLTRGPVPNGVKERKPIYWVQIHGETARALMRELRPHMGRRRGEQIDSSLSRPNGPRRYDLKKAA